MFNSLGIEKTQDSVEIPFVVAETSNLDFVGSSLDFAFWSGLEQLVEVYY